MTDEYEEIIRARSAAPAAGQGIVPAALAPHLFPHQRDLTRWALRRCRAAVFADTGLGKTAIEIEWSAHVSTKGRVLILAPLAVAEQISREAERWGVAIPYRREDAGDPITVTNYEMLHHFDASLFAGVVLDEASILKSYDGATKRALCDAFVSTPYKLVASATPAPNDFTELGNQSEFLGIKSRVEMLAEYFVHDGGSTQDWRLKGHAEDAFWRWVCTWGAMVKRPSDLGHDDGGFALPPLEIVEHTVPVDHTTAHAAGMLFASEAQTLNEQRTVRRATMSARVELAAKLAEGDEPALVWCELNDESAALTKAIPGAVEVTGSDEPEVKAERLLAFAGGKSRVLVSKSSIAGFGLNLQVCNRMIFVGASHSYEQTYQAIRRCWRFGQTRPVTVHVILAETDGAIIANFKRKQADAEQLSREMVARMGETMRAEIHGAVREWNEYQPKQTMTAPTWARRAR